MDNKDIAKCFNCNNEFAHSDQEIHEARLLLINALQENMTFEKFKQVIGEYMRSRKMTEEEQEKQMERVYDVENYFE